MKGAAKTVLKFRVAKTAKDAILGVKAPLRAGQTGKQVPPTAPRTGPKAGLPQPSTNAKASTAQASRKVAGGGTTSLHARLK
jgi:hypothetical protein